MGKLTVSINQASEAARQVEQAGHVPVYDGFNITVDALDDAALLAVVDVSGLGQAALATGKADAKRRVIAFADLITDAIFSTYPRAEIASWPDQAAQARRVVNNSETLDPSELLVNLAAKAGETVPDYAAAVLVKAAAFSAIAAEVKSLRDQSEVAIDAVTDIDDIEPLLLTLKAQATATATAMGIVL